MGNINKRQKYQQMTPPTPPPAPSQEQTPPVVQDVHIPDWAEIDPKAKKPTKQGKPMRKAYRHHIKKQKEFLDVDHKEKISDISFLRQLGAGGWGTVWLCEITKYDQNNTPETKVVACKVLSIYMYEKVNLVKASMKMMKEADMMRELDHPHLVKCEFVVHLEDQSKRKSRFPYMNVLIFMDLCSEDLLDYMSRINRPMTEDEAYNWFVQIADAIRYLHYDRRIAHLDIKPTNILIKRDANQQDFVTVKLTDFGIAERFGENEFTAIKNLKKGTQPFMAPEIKTNLNVSYDACRADIYSFGLTLAQSVSGYRLADRDELVADLRTMESMIDPRINRNYIVLKWSIGYELIELLLGMLHMVADQRYDINKVWFSEWVSRRPYSSGDPFYLSPV